MKSRIVFLPVLSLICIQSLSSFIIPKFSCPIPNTNKLIGSRLHLIRRLYVSSLSLICPSVSMNTIIYFYLYFWDSKIVQFKIGAKLVGPANYKNGKHFLYSEITSFFELRLGLCLSILTGKQCETFP